MKASKQLTPNLKTAVSVLRTADLSHRKIAEQLGYSNLAISKFLCRYDASGDLNRKSGSNGIKKSSEEDDAVLEQLLLQDFEQQMNCGKIGRTKPA